MTSTWGVDLSNHNAGANIAKAHAAGCAFVFAKATEGLTFTDPLFAGFRNDAHAAGVPFGAYHYAHPQRGRSAVDEAKHFVQTIGTVRTGELPPVLDLEQTGLGPHDTGMWAGQWMRTVQALTGVEPMLYAAPYFLGAKVAKSDLAHYRLWLASYRDTTPTAPAPWGSWLFWQHTSTAHVPGIPGNVDRNVTRLTPAGVRALCRPAPTTPRPVPPVQPPAGQVHTPPRTWHPPVAAKPAPPRPAVVRTKAGGVVLGARVLREGDHGPDVLWVQRFLGITADSSFGTKTHDAVKVYQHMRGLDADGVVGKITWANLLSRR